MAIIETAKTIAELAKKGMTVELQEKIMELRVEAMDMKEEIIQLRDENSQLRQDLEEYSKGAKCPKCLRPAWKVESSKPSKTGLGRLGVIDRTYKCSDCGFTETHTETPGVN